MQAELLADEILDIADDSTNDYMIRQSGAEGKVGGARFARVLQALGGSEASVDDGTNAPPSPPKKPRFVGDAIGGLLLVFGRR